MISKISGIITEKLLTKGCITESDKELYEYGFFLLLSYSFFFSVTIVFGLFFRKLRESILFYISFSILREYAGGYHAKKEITCFISTTCSLLICVALIYWIEKYNLVCAFMGLSIGGAGIVSLMGPLDSQEKSLSCKEKKHYRRKTRIIIAWYVALAVTGYIVKMPGIAVSLSIAVIFEACLLSLGEISSKRLTRYAS